MSDVDEAFARSGCAVPGDKKLNAHNLRVWRDAWAAATREAAGEIERLRKIEDASRNLVQQKGRNHTQQAYDGLDALIKEGTQ